MKKLVLITASLAALPLLAVAKSEAANSDNEAMEHIIVSATRSEQASIEIPASIQVLTSEQIRLSGATSLVQVLNAQPGIQINDNIGSLGRGASISMRGFGDNTANNVLVMVDGRKLNNPTLSTPDLSSVAIKDIERVEIIQGSAGTLYGDQATGGVINIITKQSGELTAFVDATRGTHDLERYRASASQQFDNGLNYRLSAEKLLADNYRDNNDNKRTNLFSRIGHVGEAYKVFIEYAAIDDDLRLPGSLSRAEMIQDRKQSSTPNYFSNRETDTYRMGGEYELSKRWLFLGEYTDTDEKGSGNFFGAFEQVSEKRSFQPRVSGSFDTEHGDALVTVGVDWAEAEYQHSQTFADVDQTNQDFYAQLIFPFTSELKFTVGARYSEFEYENNSTQGEYEDDVSVMQLGLSYQANDKTRYFVRLDQGFRWPNIDENAFTAMTVEYLLPQETDSIELGAETRIGSVGMSVLAYRLSADNEIIYDPTATGPSSAFGFDGANINIDESIRNGVVVGLNWQLNDRLNVLTNFSYVDAEIDSGTFKGKTLPFVAEQTANLIINYQLNENFSIYWDAQYLGERYLSGDQANSAEPLGGYTIYNANLRYDLNQVYVQLRANNITGKEYTGFSGGSEFFEYHYPAPQQTYQLTVGYNF